VTTSGTFAWNITVAASAVNVDDRFLLRFVPAISPPNYFIPASGMSPSRFFELKVRPSPDNPSGNATSATHAPFTPVGTIVGGVLGGVALITLNIIAWLMWRLVQRTRAQGLYEHKAAVELFDNQTAPM
jgi:hypothetical protein